MAERPTTDELLQRLAGRGQLAADDLRRAQAWARDAAAETPWYLQPFLFLGALLAAGMITFGIAEILDLRWQGAETTTLGGVYLAAALVSHLSRSGSFTDHLGLALSIGGHAFVSIGIVRLTETDHPEMIVLLTSTGLCVALYGAYRDFLHRLLSCLLVFVVARFAFPATDLPDALHGVVAAMVLACTLLLARARQLPLWRPLAYACSYGLPVLLLPLGERGLWFEDPELPHAWLSGAALGLGTLWALRFAAFDLGARVSLTARVLAVLFVAGLCALSAPGILAALFLIVLGYACQHWPVVLAGLAALPVFLFKYYYNLDLDLMAKSGVLAGSGALLLLARWAFTRAEGQQP